MTTEFTEVQDTSYAREIVPYQNEAEPLFYSEGEDISELTSFLNDFSEPHSRAMREEFSKNEDSIESRYPGDVISAPDLAEEIENLDLEGGYNVAMYDHEQLGSPEQLHGEPEIIARISPDLPRNTFERITGQNADLEEGLALSVSSEKSFEELWNMAQDSELKEVRYTHRVRNFLAETHQRRSEE